MAASFRQKSPAFTDAATATEHNQIANKIAQLDHFHGQFQIFFSCHFFVAVT